MFASTVVLGRLAGIEIGINWTWIPVFGLFVWTLAGVEFPSATPGRSWFEYAVMGVVAAAAFFASLILHELGHALRARREGVQIEGITLWLFGGVAKIAGEFPSAGAEFRIAVAGPLVTLALGTAFLLASAVSPLAGAIRAVLVWLGYINLTLLVFNLVPAMPLDGGRMLRAALWARGHDLTAATRRATRIGGALATLLIFLGVLETLAGVLSGLWLAVVGWFILEAGRAEERQIQTRHALEGATVATLMTRDPVILEAGQSLEEAAATLRGTARHTAYPWSTALASSACFRSGPWPVHRPVSGPPGPWVNP